MVITEEEIIIGNIEYEGNVYQIKKGIEKYKIKM